MKKIVVTGGSGKAGRATIVELLEHGYEVLNIDIVAPEKRQGNYLTADLTKYGETIEVLAGYDAIVHLAAIPAPGRFTEAVTFHTNMAQTYNIFQGAVTLGIKRIVWASSETTIGLPFEREQPAYAPIDEDHPLYPESSYALSKVLMEEMARQYNRWHRIPIVGLRFSNIMEPHDYTRYFERFWDDAHKRKGNLWGYVDARDVAQSCRLSLEADLQGAEVFLIAAADTCMPRPNKDLMAEVFPDVPLYEGVGEYETLLSITKARNLLGYAPKYSWRDHLTI